jgi:hypothetical protein
MRKKRPFVSVGQNSGDAIVVDDNIENRKWKLPNTERWNPPNKRILNGDVNNEGEISNIAKDNVTNPAQSKSSDLKEKPPNHISSCLVSSRLVSYYLLV